MAISLYDVDDLSSWLALARDMGEVRDIEGASWDLEIGAASELNYKHPSPPALLFDNVDGYDPGRRVLTGSMANARRLGMTLRLGTSLTDRNLVEALRDKPSEWVDGAPRHQAREVDSGPVLENVLKADHHGSCNGVTNAYLNAVNPQYVTASVAASNTFKHMNTQAKAMYTAHGEPWYRTDQNGTIVFRTPGSPGGGYTVSVLKGTTNMSGPSDAASVDAECNPIP